MQNNENTALQVQNQGFLTLANADSGSMAEELDGLEIQFERIKIPSGGGTVFEVPGEGDEPDNVKDFTAVILHHHPLNCHYKDKYSGGSNPPDCGSFDGITGVGDPGGACKSCPLNQYGTADEGDGKACKNRRRIYLLREGEMFPMLLSLPTGSLKTFTKYLQSQLTKGRTSGGIVTKFSLKKATNAGGIAYSQAVFAFERTLSLEEQRAVKPLSEQVKAYSGKVGFDSEATETVNGIEVNSDTGEVKQEQRCGGLRPTAGCLTKEVVP